MKDTLPKAVDNEFKKRVDNGELEDIFRDVFLATNNKLNKDSGIETDLRLYLYLYSGSTCCSVIFLPERLICANVGDSRAVIGSFESGVWKAHNLSRDHKPDDKEELKRILACKGRVQPYKGHSS